MDRRSERSWIAHGSAWSTLSRWGRLRAALSWRLLTTWAGIIGGMTPGEKYLLGLLSRNRKTRRRQR